MIGSERALSKCQAAFEECLRRRVLTRLLILDRQRTEGGCACRVCGCERAVLDFYDPQPQRDAVAVLALGGALLCQGTERLHKFDGGEPKALLQRLYLAVGF